MTGTKAALVTGASRGIGFAIAAALAEEGWDLTVVARHQPRLTEAAARLRQHGGRVSEAAVDLTRPEAATTVVESHLTSHSALSLLVANAGTGTAGPVASLEPASLEQALTVNVRALVRLLRAALPELRRAAEAGYGARVIAIASMAALTPAPGFAGYSASKAAVLSLARSVAAEERRAGIRVSAICPGFVETDMTSGLPGLDRAALLRPGDVAEAVRFLVRLSPAAEVSEVVLARHAAGPGES